MEKESSALCCLRVTVHNNESISKIRPSSEQSVILELADRVEKLEALIEKLIKKQSLAEKAILNSCVKDLVEGLLTPGIPTNNSTGKKEVVNV